MAERRTEVILAGRRGGPATALMLALLLIAGCASTGSERVHDGAAALLEEGVDAARAGDDGRALEHLAAVLEEHPDAPEAARALLERAHLRYRRGEPGAAKRDAEAYLARGTGDAGREYALHLRAQAATAAWQEAPEREGLGGARRAFDLHREVLEHFPDGRYAARSFEAMLRLRNDIGQRELARAARALAAGDARDAAERADYVARRYRGSPVAAQALALQVEALEELGEATAAARARRRLDSLHGSGADEPGSAATNSGPADAREEARNASGGGSR